MKKTTFYLFKLTTIAFALPEGIGSDNACSLQTRTQENFTASNTIQSTVMNAMATTNTNDKISS